MAWRTIPQHAYIFSNGHRVLFPLNHVSIMPGQSLTSRGGMSLGTLEHPVYPEELPFVCYSGHGQISRR